ncbi:Conserved_hypothetical protein [Hexamita inflata]|uniref:Uncharacterized protein n=1 Tax=Hexamita inflata TaxID=28002 RepID=A0AA86TEB6_9EUKA|nr:Conserved hypothetical protein [Hexamita inflata]
MLRVRKQASVTQADGVHYFNMFDLMTTVDVDTTRSNMNDALLPDQESDSLFFQTVHQLYQVQPGEPFLGFYVHCKRNFQLIGQILHAPGAVFEYLASFYQALFKDKENHPENLYSAYLNATQAVPDLFRDLGSDYSQYLLNFCHMLRINVVCENPQMFQQAIVSVFQSIKYLQPSNQIMTQVIQFMLQLNVVDQYKAVLCEIPAHYIRTKGGKLSDLAEFHPISFGSFSLVNQFYEAENDFEEEEEEEYESKEMREIQPIKECKQYTEIFKKFAPSIAVQVIRRPNGELNTNWKKFVDTCAFLGEEFKQVFCIYCCECDFNTAHLIMLLQYLEMDTKVLKIYMQQYYGSLTLEQMQAFDKIFEPKMNINDFMYKIVYQLLNHNIEADFNAFCDKFKDEVKQQLQELVIQIQFACGHSGYSSRTDLIIAEFISAVKQKYTLSLNEQSIISRYSDITLSEQQIIELQNQLNTVDKETFQVYYELIKQCHVTIQSKEEMKLTENTLLNILNIMTESNQQILFQKLQETSSPQVYSLICEKLFQTNIDQKYLDCDWLISNLQHQDGRIRSQTVKLFAPNCKIFDILSDLMNPTDVLKINGNLFMLVNELKKGFDMFQLKVVVIASFGLLFSRYEIIQDQIINLFDYLSNQQQTKEIIAKYNVVQQFFNQKQDLDLDLDQFLTIQAKHYKYNVLENEQQEEDLRVKVKNAQKKYKASLMFLNPVLINNELNQNLLFKKTIQLISAQYEDIINHGITSSDIIQINNCVNIDFQTRVNKLWKIIWNNSFTKILHFNPVNFSTLKDQIRMIIRDARSKKSALHLKFILAQIVAFSPNDEELKDILKVLLLNTQNQDCQLQTLLAFHATTKSPYCIVQAQILNNNALLEQLAAITYERENVGDIFNFAPLEKTFETSVNIQYAFSFKEKINRFEDNIQSRFGNAFTVSDFQTASFNQDITLCLVNKLLSTSSSTGARRAIINFVDCKFDKEEIQQFYQYVAFVMLGQAALAQQYQQNTNYLSLIGQDNVIDIMIGLSYYQILDSISNCQILIESCKNIQIKHSFFHLLLKLVQLLVIENNYTDKAVSFEFNDQMIQNMFKNSIYYDLIYQNFAKLQQKVMKTLTTTLFAVLQQSDLTEVIEENNNAVDIEELKQETAIVKFENLSTTIFQEIIGNVEQLGQVLNKIMLKQSAVNIVLQIIMHFEFFSEVFGYDLLCKTAEAYSSQCMKKTTHIEYFEQFNLLLTKFTPDQLIKVKQNVEMVLPKWVIEFKKMTGDNLQKVRVVVQIITYLKCQNDSLSKFLISYIHDDTIKELVMNYFEQVPNKDFVFLIADHIHEGTDLSKIYKACLETYSDLPVYNTLYGLSSSPVESLKDLDLKQFEYVAVCDTVINLFLCSKGQCQELAHNVLINHIQKVITYETIQHIPSSVKNIISKTIHHIKRACSDKKQHIIEMCLTILEQLCSQNIKEYLCQSLHITQQQMFEDLQTILKVSEVYQYADILFYYHLLSEFKIVLDKQDLFTKINQIFRSSILGRLLISGAVKQQNFMKNVLVPIIVYLESHQTDLSTEVYTVLACRCTPDVYFTLYDELIVKHSWAINILFSQFRFGQKIQQQEDQESIELAKGFNNFNLSSIQSQLKKKLKRFYPLLLQKSTEKTFSNIYQVLSQNSDLNHKTVQIIAKLFKQAQMTFELKTLQQRILQKLLEKSYSRRDKARQILSCVSQALGLNKFEETISNIQNVFQVQTGCMCSAAVEAVIRRLVYIDVKNISQIVCTKTDLQLAQIFESDQFVQRSITFNVENDYDHIVVSEAFNKYQMQQLLRIVQEDLYNRKEADEKLVKIFQEFADKKALGIVEIVSATMNMKLLINDFVKPLISGAVDRHCDVMELAECIVKGIVKNPLADKQSVYDIIYYLNDTNTCFYCKIKPQAVYSVNDRRQQIMQDETLTQDQRIVKLRYQHQLLEKAPERQLGITTQAQANQNYNENFCCYVSVLLIKHGISNGYGDKYNKIFNVKNNLKSYMFGNLKQMKSYSITEFNAIQDLQPAIIDYNEIYSFLDLAIYSNSFIVLMPAYECVTAIVQAQQQKNLKLSITQSFLEQTMKQLYKTNDQKLSQILLNLFQFIIDNHKNLMNDTLQQKLFQTCALAVKSRQNMLKEPYQVIDRFVQNNYEHTIVYDQMDYYLNFSVNSFANSQLPKICQALVVSSLSHFILSYKLPDKARELKILSLVKLSVEAELNSTKLLSLQCLQQIFFKLNTFYLENFAVQFGYSMLAAHSNSKGLEKEELKSQSCRTFASLQANELNKNNLVTQLFSKFFGNKTRLSQILLFLADFYKINVCPIQVNEFYTRNEEQLFSIMHQVLGSTDEEHRILFALLEYIQSNKSTADKLTKFIIQHQTELVNSTNMQIRRKLADIVISLHGINQFQISAFNQETIDQMFQNYFDHEFVLLEEGLIKTHEILIIQLLSFCSLQYYSTINLTMLEYMKINYKIAEHMANVLINFLQVLRENEEEFIQRLQQIIIISLRLQIYKERDMKYVAQLLINKARKICKNSDVFEYLYNEAREGLGKRKKEIE